ncbi:unnamed protein product [Durusdinium trenchii]|uniref:Hydrolase RBBP9 n=1 Tax=Durusdinium trenchii TaxID=1381693 RepID=A0ABP0HEJ7_9DINO
MSLLCKRCIIVPGNGCTNAKKSNWYGRAQEELTKTGLFKEVIVENMPDPHVARESVWLPFLQKLGADEDAVLIGHSSGAEATMRLLEKQKLRGAVLVSACHTDLGDENERASGYYDRPWEWTAIAENAGFILQWHSTDDPFIPISEARHVAESLGEKCEYIEHEKSSHFFKWDVFGNELLEKLMMKLQPAESVEALVVEADAGTSSSTPVEAAVSREAT